MVRLLLRWIPIAAAIGAMAGTASAVLLVSLNYATAVREAHVWIIALLAPAGFAVGLMYHYLGRSVERGNNLLLEEIHAPSATIPARMTPLILIGTFLTHLFGGSAGREGTALQTGASLADQLSRPLKLAAHERRIVLMAGIAAGFGSVFGTPLAGAVFGLEVLAIGRMDYAAILPCFLAAFAGDLVTRAWHVHHTVYAAGAIPAVSWLGAGAAMVAGIAFGLTARGFAEATHGISALAKRWVAFPPLRPAVGGVVVSAAVFGAHTTKYIGLGIPTILASFSERLPVWDWAGKFAFTVVTLGAGFKGGEVTPLFYIGSTLGNALSHVLPLPVGLLAAMGFAAVFGGAANTPIAATLMAVELFGAEAGAYAGIACVVSYLFSGHGGIYNAQRVGKSKHVTDSAEEGLSLGSIANPNSAAHRDIFDDINEAVYSGGDEMEHLSVLRLYFSASQMRRADSWWKRIAPQSLGPYLLKQAKDHGIEQALLHRVIGGYLHGRDLVMDTGEIPPGRLPQCLELVGEEEDLNSFLKENRDHLKSVRIIMLRGIEAEVEAAVDEEELEQALEIESGADFKVAGSDE